MFKVQKQYPVFLPFSFSSVKGRLKNRILIKFKKWRRSKTKEVNSALTPKIQKISAAVLLVCQKSLPSLYSVSK